MCESSHVERDGSTVCYVWLCLSPIICSRILTRLLVRPAAETDGGAAGGGVWRQAESVAREKRAGVQTAQHPGPGTFPSLLPLVSVSAAKCVRFSVWHFFWLERNCLFWVLRAATAFLKEDGEKQSVCVTVVLCRSGEPEGCGDGEEAEERPEEDQSPSGWCTDYAGPPEEQCPQQEGDRPAQKSSMPL